MKRHTHTNTIAYQLCPHTAPSCSIPTPDPLTPLYSLLTVPSMSFVITDPISDSNPSRKLNDKLKLSVNASGPRMYVHTYYDAPRSS